MAEDAEELTCVVRSCLVSSTTVLKANQLKRDCEDFLGKEFPFRKLGFSTFVGYLATIPTVVRLVPPNSDNPDVQPVQSEKSKHVDELIQRQRKPVARSRYAPPLRKRPAAITSGFTRQQGRNSYNSRSLSNNNNSISRSNGYSSVRPNAISNYPSTRSTSTFENVNVKSPSPPIPKGLYVSDVERNMRRHCDERSLRENGLNSGEDLLNHAKDLVTRVGDKVYPNMKEPPVTTLNSSKRLEAVKPPTYSPYNEDLEKPQSTVYSNGKFNTTASPAFSNKVLETRESTPNASNTPNATDNLEFDYYEDFEGEDYDSECDDFWTMPEEEISNYTIKKCSQSLLDSDHHKYSYQSEPESQEYESPFSDVMIENFKTIMAKYPGGIWASELPKKYLEVTGAKLDHSDLGFSNIIDLVSSASDVFHFIREDTHDWKLYDARLPLKDIVVPKIDLTEVNDTEKYVPHSILQEIEQLLDEHPGGFKSTFLHDLYKQRYKKRLNLEALGFNKFDDFAEVLKSVIRVTPSMDYYILQKKLKCVKIPKEERQDPLTLPESDMKTLVPKDTLCPSDALPLQELPPINENCTENQPLLELTLRVGEVISPARFFVMLQDQFSALEILMEEMLKFYGIEEANYHVPMIYVKPGLFCVALYHGNEEWHRAKITRVTNMDEIHVEFVDYGTPGEVKKSDLRLLHKDFAKLPTQAICARLIGIKPINKEKRYSTAACQRFLSIVSDRVLWAHVYAINTKKIRLQLDLVLHDTHGSEEVVCSQVLIDNKLAEFANMDEDIPTESELDPQLPEELPVPQWTEPNKSHESKAIPKPPPGFESSLCGRSASLDSPKSCHSTPEPSIPFPPPDSISQQTQFQTNHLNSLGQILLMPDGPVILNNMIRSGSIPNVVEPNNSHIFTAPTQQYHRQNYYLMPMASGYDSVYQTLPTNYPHHNQALIDFPQTIYCQQPNLQVTPFTINNYGNLPISSNNVAFSNVQPKSGMPIRYFSNTAPTMGNQHNMSMPFTPNMTTGYPAQSFSTSRPIHNHYTPSVHRPYVQTPSVHRPYVHTPSVHTPYPNTPNLHTPCNNIKPNPVPNSLDQCQKLRIEGMPDLTAINIPTPLPSTTCKEAKTCSEDKLAVSLNSLPLQIAELPTPAPQLSPTSVAVAGIPQPLDEKLPISCNPMPLEISELPTSPVTKLSPTSVAVAEIPQPLDDKLPISRNPMPLEIAELSTSPVPKLSPTSAEVAGISAPLEVNGLNVPLVTSDQTQDSVSGRLSVPISVSSIDSKSSKYKNGNCTSDEYLSASESVEDSEKCIFNKDAVESSPEKVPDIFDDDIPDSWEDLDSQPVTASNYDHDFKVPLDLLIGDFNDNSIKIENVNEDSSFKKQPPLNWLDMYPDILTNKCKRVDEPDVTKTSRTMEIITSVKNTLIQKLEIDSISFHLVYVHDNLAVLAKEFYPQFSDMKMASLEKILEAHRPFTSITKADQPALFTAVDKVEFCGGVDKKTVIRLGKIVSISFLKDVPELLKVLNVTNKVFLERIKEISESHST